MYILSMCKVTRSIHMLNLAKLSTICDDGHQQDSVTGIDIQESQDGDSDNNIT